MAWAIAPRSSSSESSSPRVRGDVADEPAGERVAGAGGVDDALQRVGGQREEALPRDERGAVLALLGHDHARAPATPPAPPAAPHERISRAAASEVGLAGQLAQLGVVEDHAVDALDRAHERVAGDVDPQVHRVERHEARAGQLARAPRAAARGWMLARNSTSLERERSESLGWKPSNTPSWVSSVSREFRSQPYSPCQKNVLPPATRSTSETSTPRRRITSSCCLAEVVADRADDAHVVEERGGQGEVHGRAAEHPLALAERRLDGVEGDRSDHGDRHGRAP